MKILVTFAFFLLSTAVYAKNVIPGMTLGKAKEALISKGWRPVNPHSGDGYRYIGIENDLIRKGYLEVESCAIDRALCIFEYRKNGECAKLLTQGEEVQAMRVISINHDCQGKAMDHHENATPPSGSISNRQQRQGAAIGKPAAI